jgi:hypothetical protein
MRQGQQNRRGRGRNRKGQSPLTRSFESTGPDVKIRGTPAHIAEKYISLARDATSSGDPVLAENYLQHAEHYNRIIMAVRDQVGAGGDMNGGMGRRPYMGNDPMDPGDEYSDDDGDDGEMQPHQPQHQHAPMRPHDPQPRIDGQRFEGQRGGHEQHRYRDRPQERSPDRSQDRDRHDRDRHERHDRGGEQRGYQPPRQQVNDQSAEGGPQQPSPEGRRRDRFQPTHEQPEFLRRPVRRPRREGNGTPTEANGTIAEETDHD